jgi:hypothetical protein
VEGTIIKQQYLQQLQNEVIPVIQGAGNMNIANHLDILYDVFGNHLL